MGLVKKCIARRKQGGCDSSDQGQRKWSW